MRKIPVIKWTIKTPDGKDGTDSTLTVLNVVISATKPEDMPRGIDQFRLFNRLSKAFEQAEKTDVIILEEMDYSLMKRLLETGIPGIWAMNKDITSVVEAFLNAPMEAT